MSSIFQKVTSRLVSLRHSGTASRPSFTIKQRSTLSLKKPSLAASSHSKYFSTKKPDDDDDPAAWIPPQLSPLLTNKEEEVDFDSMEFPNQEEMIGTLGDVISEEENEDLTPSNMDEFMKEYPGFLDDFGDDIGMEDFVDDLITGYKSKAEEDPEIGDKNAKTPLDDADRPTSAHTAETPDWLSTRRKKLQPVAMLKPSEKKLAIHLDGEIAPIPHTLLSSDEIKSCLEYMGGQDVVVVNPTRGNLDFDGFVIATGTSTSHLRTMADVLVRNLRKRKLQKRGVRGAQLGPEGGKDDYWLVVDCDNYLVHLQDDLTRKSMNLEKWWTEGRRDTQFEDEDEAMEDFVEKNPIPEEYSERFLRDGRRSELDIVRNLEKMKLHKIGRTGLKKAGKKRRK